MPYVKIKDGVVIQKQSNPETGFIKASDSVVCGMLVDGNGYKNPPSRQRTTEELEHGLESQVTARDLRKAVLGDQSAIARIQAIESQIEAL
jgi:hypothetical protein